MLTPRDKKLLVKYFDSVDSAIAARLISGFRPHEDHLTAILCELLDSDQSPLHRLAYSFDDLVADLAVDSSAMRVSIRLETRKYPPHVESRTTSSDIGMIIEYRDYIGDSGSFDRGVLFQAKRLHQSHASSYTIDDEFAAFDHDQFDSLSALQKREWSTDPKSSMRDHCDWCYYLFYCPQAPAFDDWSREIIRRHIVPNDDIFDYSKGWHLYEFATSPARQVPGVIVSSLDPLNSIVHTERPRTRAQRLTKPTARDVFQRFWSGSQPFSWFLAYELLSGRVGTSSDDALRIVRGDVSDVDGSVPLPRYVMTVRLQAGQG